MNETHASYRIKTDKRACWYALGITQDPDGKVIRSNIGPAVVGRNEIRDDLPIANLQPIKGCTVDEVMESVARYFVDIGEVFVSIKSEKS